MFGECTCLHFFKKTTLDIFFKKKEINSGFKEASKNVYLFSSCNTTYKKERSLKASDKSYNKSTTSESRVVGHPLLVQPLS